jgi:hypothetical protein
VITSRLRGVENDAVGAVPSPRRPLQSVTGELAEAHTALRAAAPAGRWDDVLAEVGRLQREESLSPLAALQAVSAKLASGWLPPVTR